MSLGLSQSCYQDSRGTHLRRLSDHSNTGKMDAESDISSICMCVLCRTIGAGAGSASATETMVSM